MNSGRRSVEPAFPWREKTPLNINNNILAALFWDWAGIQKVVYVRFVAHSLV